MGSTWDTKFALMLSFPVFFGHFHWNWKKLLLSLTNAQFLPEWSTRQTQLNHKSAQVKICSILFLSSQRDTSLHGPTTDMGPFASCIVPVYVLSSQWYTLCLPVGDSLRTWLFGYILRCFICTHLKKVTHPKTNWDWCGFSLLTRPAETQLGDLLPSDIGTNAYKCFQQFILSNCMAWSCHVQEIPAKMAIPWPGYDTARDNVLYAHTEGLLAKMVKFCHMAF